MELRERDLHTVMTKLPLLVLQSVFLFCVAASTSASSRGGHSNRLYTNTRDRGQELGQAVKAENLEGQAVKGTSQIRKSQGSSTVKVNRIQNLIKARYHTLNSVKSKAYLSDGQAVKALIKVKFFDRAVAGVGTESIGVTSPCSSSCLFSPFDHLVR